MTTEADRERFERTFSTHDCGCRRTCDCGHVYYDTVNEWDWEEGEEAGLAQLEREGKATGVPHSVGSVVFEGNEYAADCECWHERAGKITSWLNRHHVKIAAYLNMRRADALATMPSVEDSP